MPTNRNLAISMDSDDCQAEQASRNDDRRKTIRVASNRPVVMRVQDSTVFATMTDFSKHGLGFIAMCDLDRNEQVEVHFDIPFKDGFKSFLFSARVKHCIDLFDKNHIGVRLDIGENEYCTLFDRIVAG